MAPNFAERIKPVDPERFHFALGVYCAAAAMKGPYENPQQHGLHMLDDAGKATDIRFADIPANRGMLAVKKEFADPEEFQRLGFRILTFSQIVNNPRLAKMGVVRRDENGNLEVHDAVVNALAMAPFRKSGVLDQPAFFALVKGEHKKIEAEEAGKAGVA